MKIGDLVRITDVGPDDARGLGTILKFDTYQSQRSYPSKFRVDNQQDPPWQDENIVEVLWSGTHIGWILQRRLEVLNESR